MTRMLCLSDLSLKGKRVLIRVDFNVPQDKNAIITDDSRIRASLPTIRYALDHGASVILMSHLGRPKGKRDKIFSLAPVAKRLSELLRKPVKMAPDCIGLEVEKLALDMHPGDILLLENLRFHDAEEHPEKDPSFAAQLARLGDIYVDDAFGAAHRSHASISDITRHFKSRSAAGFLLKSEIAALDKVLRDPKRPFYAILGGAKISTKINIVKALLDNVDALFLGGAMAFTFLKALGHNVGDSLVENDFLTTVKEILSHAEETGVQLQLPTDAVIAALDDPEGSHCRVIALDQSIPKGYRGVDIGPGTIDSYIRELQKAKTVFWNGPVGIFEVPAFAKGTYAIAKALAESDAVTVVGGGDSAAAVNALGLGQRISHLSTGGGAALEYIELGTLPGVEALTQTH